MRFPLRLARWAVARVLLMFVWSIRAVTAPLRSKRRLVLGLELRGDLPDVRVRPPFFARGGRGDGPGLVELLRALSEATRDPAVHGILIRVEDLSAGWAPLWELRQALLAAREAGKEVVVHADSLDMRTWWVSTAASKLLLAPQGMVDLSGFRAEVILLRPLLDKLGIKAEFLRAGRFKSYAEMFTETHMTPAVEEAMGALLDDLSTLWRDESARGRGRPPEDVAGWMERGPFRAERALAEGLVDGLAYLDEVETTLEDAAEGAGLDLVVFPLQRYGAGKARLARWRRPLRRGARIVVLEAAGAIVEGSGGGVRRPTHNISRDTYQEILGTLIEDPSVHGVVLRVDSPGGSALVSDLLWRDVKRLREKKPVYVSMRGVAASGGYYVSAPAERIYASPSTITGSIGVVAGKFQGGNLLARLGVGVEAVQRGGRAGMYGVDRGFSEEERAALQEDVDAMYTAFTDRVREGRGLSADGVEAAAQGRIWSGTRAVQLGLVDELGGIMDAVGQLKERLGREHRSVEVAWISLPSPLDWVSLLASGGALRGLWAGLKARLGAELAPAGAEALLRSVAAPGLRMLAVLPVGLRLR